MKLAIADPAEVAVHGEHVRAGARFAGAKPPRWTRWVLDALGYDPAVDTVDDLFPGSGYVSTEIHQGVIL